MVDFRMNQWIKLSIDTNNCNNLSKNIFIEKFCEVLQVLRRNVSKNTTKSSHILVTFPSPASTFVLDTQAYHRVCLSPLGDHPCLRGPNLGSGMRLLIGRLHFPFVFFCLTSPLFLSLLFLLSLFVFFPLPFILLYEVVCAAG